MDSSSSGLAKKYHARKLVQKATKVVKSISCTSTSWYYAHIVKKPTLPAEDISVRLWGAYPRGVPTSLATYRVAHEALSTD